MRPTFSLAAALAALCLHAGLVDAQQTAPRVRAPTLRAGAVVPTLRAPRVMATAPRVAVVRSTAVRTVPMRTMPLRGVLRAGAALPRAAAHVSPVVTVLQRMETTLTYTRHSPDNRIDPLMGHYEVDAPGLVTWVLRRATPAAHRAVFAQVRARSPTARDYHDILASLGAPGAPSEAWLALHEVGALRPGDVIAWRRTPGVHVGGTHVAFVVAAPVRSPQHGGWLVRVTDSTAVPHDNDTRGPQAQHRSGLGTGTLLLTVDPTTDAPTGYGWLGARTSTPTLTSVALGRPLR